MANILYIWELGGGLGHLTTALPLAKAYRADGHQIAFVVKDIAAASVVIPADNFSVYQAPIWQTAAGNATQAPASYAEILLQHGFGDAKKLASMVHAWLNLLRLLKPDLLLLDFSPTAMLAASIAGIRHCTIGHGFFLPPKTTPIPPFVDNVSPARLQTSEARVLHAINQVRLQLGSPALTELADFFDADRDLLTTWPEIEHYPQRRNAYYCGPVLMRGEGRSAAWPDMPGPRVFAYLYGRLPQLPNVLQGILDSKVNALIYAPGMPSDLQQRFSNERLTFSTTPYAMHQVLAQADALICHSSFGTVWEGLLAGKPIVCVPIHMEQHIVAVQLRRLGAAILVERDKDAAHFTDAIRQLTDETSYRLAAEHVAQRYRKHDVNQHLAELVAASLAVISFPATHIA